jgi:hypothetical protein
MIFLKKIYIIFIIIFIIIVLIKDKNKKYTNEISDYILLSICILIFILLIIEIILFVKDLLNPYTPIKQNAIVNILFLFSMSWFIFAFIYYCIHLITPEKMFIDNTISKKISNKNVLLNCLYFSVSNSFMNSVDWLTVKGNLLKTIIMIQMIFTSIFLFYLIDKILEYDIITQLKINQKITSKNIKKNIIYKKKSSKI